jgi:hypothetical protein
MQMYSMIGTCNKLMLIIIKIHVKDIFTMFTALGLISSAECSDARRLPHSHASCPACLLPFAVARCHVLI